MSLRVDEEDDDPAVWGDDIRKPGWEQYPRIADERVKPLWMLGCWDGPLSGICEVDGDPCYFDMAAELGERRDRAMLVYRLTPEQWDVHSRRHRIWQEQVGTHTDFVNGTWKREHALVSGWMERWDATIAAINACGSAAVDDAQIIGWFMH